MKKKAFLWAGVAVLAIVATLLAAIVIRTATLISKQRAPDSSPVTTPDADDKADRLAGAINARGPSPNERRSSFHHCSID